MKKEKLGLLQKRYKNNIIIIVHHLCSVGRGPLEKKYTVQELGGKREWRCMGGDGGTEEEPSKGEV